MTSSPRALALSLLIHGCIIAATVGVVFHRDAGPGGGDASALAFESRGGSLVQTEESSGRETSDLGQPRESVPPAAAVPPADMPEPAATDLVVPVESKVVTALPASAGIAAAQVPPAAEPATRKPVGRKKTNDRSEGGGQLSGTRGGGGEGIGGNGGGGPAWVAARYSRCPAPPYPATAKKDKLSGQVLLLVLVDENGRAASVVLRKSSGSPILDEAAVAAVSRWRFEPAKQNGKSVSSRVEVPVRFVAS